MITEARIEQRKHMLTTPRAAAVAGILAGALFLAIHLILIFNLTGVSPETATLLAERKDMLAFILYMVPFAGIFFLWFIGVARDRLGRWEDQLFSTVFLGSGLLYLALTFTAAAIGGGLISSYAFIEPALGNAVYRFAQSTLDQITHVYAVRMAAIFMLSSATMWRRTSVMPGWMAVLSYALGLGLLVLINFASWITIIFPAWMLIVSISILVLNYRRSPENRSAPQENVP